MKLGGLPDEQLVEQLKEGKKPAFEAIYSRYATKLYKVAFGQVGIEEEAEEIVQEVFLDLWRRGNALHINELKVYLVVAVRNKAYDFLRSQINLKRYREYVIFREIYENYNSSATINFTELSEAVDKVLGMLPEKSAEVFRKSRFENQSVKDIASHLQLSEKAVEYHITKSLKFLRDNLKAYQSDN
jgi:RNA polymerase sigma-70 factor (family 1)